jgi:hypothetical protein
VDLCFLGLNFPLVDGRVSVEAFAGSCSLVLSRLPLND